MTTIAAEDPWGINGPNFLLLYGLLLVAVFVIGLVLRRAGGRVAVATTNREPTAAEIALMNGGRTRAVVAGIAALRSAGAVGAGQRGELVATAAAPSTGLSRLDYAVYDAATRRVRTAEVVNDARVSGELDAVEESARAAGWYVGAARRRLRRRSAWLYLALGAFGVVRIIVGAAAGFPVGYLIGLSAIAILLGVILLFAVSRVTPAGRQALLRLRTAHAHLAPGLRPARDTYGTDGAAMGVAFYGASALTLADPGFAADAGIPRDSGGSSGSSGSSDSGSGSSGDSGSSSSCGGGSSGCGGGSS